jgi:acetamidase/formamidase
MRKLSLAATYIATLLLVTPVALPAKNNADDLAGRWDVTLRYAGAVVSARLNLDAQNRAAVSAERLSLKSARQGKAVTVCLMETNAADPCSVIGLRVQGAHLQGSGALLGAPLTLSGKRPLVRPANAEKVHVFEPKVFHPHYSSAIAPELRIFPGDTVRTKTIDAEGVDEHGERRSMFINPQTGPFYIEGALPGDTLVVHFKSISLNRDTADMFSSAVVANALNPEYVRSQQAAPKLDSAWKLDTARGTALLTHPSEKLKNFAVQLQPMLGCVGVAPPGGEAIASFDLGVFGGNLDYAQIGSGATVYLPVFAPGALLFMGDAHARQGDAELTGTGLETSAAVEFTVELIEGSSLGQVRVENADYIMVMGVGIAHRRLAERNDRHVALARGHVRSESGRDCFRPGQLDGIRHRRDRRPARQCGREGSQERAESDRRFRRRSVEIVIVLASA